MTVHFERNLALNREVAESDEIRVEDLIVDFVRFLVENKRVAVDQADQESKNGDTEAHGVLKKNHIFVLLTSNLQEDELIKVSGSVNETKVAVLDTGFAVLKAVALLHHVQVKGFLSEVFHDRERVIVDRLAVVAAVELCQRIHFTKLFDIYDA